MMDTQVLERPVISLKNYDSYYLELCRAIGSELEQGSGKKIVLISLYKAVGKIVDEINQKRLKRTLKPAPRWRPMTRQEYELNRRYDFCARKGWDPRHVSGKAPKRKDKPTIRMRMR